MIQTIAVASNSMHSSSPISSLTSGSFMKSFGYFYSRYWQENGDPRFNNSALLGGGPWQMLTITMTYLIAVTLFGPYMMRNRKAMENLLWPIRLYNAFMVLFNAYLYYNFSLVLNWGLDCWGCGKAMKRIDSKGLIIVELVLLSRYFDFFDSIFFVCRKKFDHLSLLHVLHHTIVPIIVWFAGRFEPTPMVVFAGYINLPIHVIMYSYYFLSTFPNLRKYLWWKKYITTIQIIQFCVDLFHGLQVVYYPFCNYHVLTYIQTIFSLTFMYLFGQFYLRNFSANKAKQTNNHSSTENKQLLSNDNKVFELQQRLVNHKGEKLAYANVKRINGLETLFETIESRKEM